MAALFGFLVFVAIVAIPIGLIWPKVILFKSAAPTRGKALAVTLVAFVAVVAVGVNLVPKPAEQAAAPQNALVAGKRGLGIPQHVVSNILTAAGYEVLRADDLRGKPRWLAKSKFAVAEVIGQDSDIASVAVTAVLVKGDAQGALSHMSMMGLLMVAVYPDWAEAGDWMAMAIKNNGGTVVRSGRRVSVGFPANIGLQFSIKADD